MYVWSEKKCLTGHGQRLKEAGTEPRLIVIVLIRLVLIRQCGTQMVDQVNLEGVGGVEAQCALTEIKSIY